MNIDNPLFSKCKKICQSKMHQIYIYKLIHISLTTTSTVKTELNARLSFWENSWKIKIFISILCCKFEILSKMWRLLDTFVLLHICQKKWYFQHHVKMKKNMSYYDVPFHLPFAIKIKLNEVTYFQFKKINDKHKCLTWICNHKCKIY